MVGPLAAHIGQAEQERALGATHVTNEGSRSTAISGGVRMTSAPVPLHTAGVPRVIDEIRIALTMSGGIALTVYEAGVAHELWRAATALDSDSPDDCTYRKALKEANGKLVVDIITGASAGGINAIFLGSALSTGADFGALHDLWLEVADLTNLAYRASPESLLDSGVIRSAMERILRQNMNREPGHPAPDKEDLIVLVTRTNLGGRRRVLTDVLGHQAVVVTKEDPITFLAVDFWQRDRLDDLVGAALATSAFPVIFPPVEMNRAYYADGGLLDNQPVGSAIRLIRDKKAAFRTRRFVIFVEPNPDSLEAPSMRKPSVAEVALQVPVLGIKGNIWNAITDMEDFNRRHVYYESLSAVMQADERRLLAERLAPPRVLAEIRFDELFLAHDPLRYARWRSVADVAFGADRMKMVAWMIRVVAAAGDMDLYLRWLRALIQGINLTIEPSVPLGAEQMALISAAEPQEETPKEALYGLLQDLLKALYPRKQSDHESPFNIGRWIDGWQKALSGPDPARRLADDLEKFVGSVHDWTNKNAVAIAKRIEEEIGRRAERHEGFRQICLSVCGIKTWEELLRKNRPIGAALFDAFKVHDRVDYALDAVTDLHHKLDIQFVRISPNDAHNLHLVGAKPPTPGGSLAPGKLAGELFGHMGGFLDERWRRNDYIWGRLDAAEVILDLLAQVYPVLDQGREFHLRALQQEILQDEHARYAGGHRRRPLPEPGVDRPRENRQWIGYGGETLASLPPEVIHDTTRYLVDTSLTLAGGNPYVPTGLLDRASRVLRALSIPLRVASWLVPTDRAAPGTRVSRTWYILGVMALLFAIGYLVGRLPGTEFMKWVINGLWIAAGALFLFLMGAVAGWHMWMVVPLTAALFLVIGAAVGPIWTAWVSSHVPLPGRTLFLITTGIVLVVLLTIWFRGGLRLRRK